MEESMKNKMVNTAYVLLALYTGVVMGKIFGLVALSWVWITFPLWIGWALWVSVATFWGLGVLLWMAVTKMGKVK